MKAVLARFMSFGMTAILMLAQPLLAQSLARADGSDLRVVAWNVSRENFFIHADDFVEALRVIDADVLILDEMSAHRSDAEVLAILARIDENAGKPWQLSYGTSGDNQRAVIAVRGKATSVGNFKLIPYPQDFADTLKGETMHAWQREHLPRSLAAGVAANAAVIELNDKRLLVIGVDLQCCGDSDDSWEERRRLVESAEIRTRMLQTLEYEKVDAIIAGGDFNALRGLGPLQVLQGKPSEPHHLLIASSAHRDGTTWTWDGRGTKFRSSHLDYVLHDANFRAVQTLTFDPETMPAQEREALGLDIESFRQLSAHRPVVVDLAWSK